MKQIESIKKKKKGVGVGVYPIIAATIFDPTTQSHQFYLLCDQYYNSLSY